MVQDPNQQSAFGLTPNVAAGLASFFMGLGGLVILLGKPPQQWVRFTAVQSIVLAITWIALVIVLNVLTIALAFVSTTLTLIIGFLGMLIALAFFVMWIIMTVKAFQGSATRFPLISDWTDRFSPQAVSMASSATYTPPPSSYTPPPPSYTAPPPPPTPPIDPTTPP